MHGSREGGQVMGCEHPASRQPALWGITVPASPGPKFHQHTPDDVCNNAASGHCHATPNVGVGTLPAAVGAGAAAAPLAAPFPGASSGVHRLLRPH